MKNAIFVFHNSLALVTSRFFCFLVICQAVFSCQFVSAQYSERSNRHNARSLLQKAQTVHLNRPPFACDAVTSVRPLDGGSPGQRGSEYLTSIRHDSGRVDLVSTRLDFTEAGGKELAYEFRDISDGKAFLHRQRLLANDSRNKNTPLAEFSYETKKTDKNYVIWAAMQSKYLDGHARITSGHYTSAMLDSKDIVLHKETDDVGGFVCAVVEASTEQGNYKVWIDVNCGYNLRRMEIQKDTYHYSVYDVKLDDINGVWFPVAGVAREQWHYDTGEKDDIQYKTSRRNVVLNPDFEAMGAFKMDLPEGTRIKNYSDRDTKYIWQEGQPKKVDQINRDMLGKQAPSLQIEKWYTSPPGRPGLNGKIVLLDFFGVWCRPCMAKIPFFKRLHELYADRGLVIIGVHTQQAKDKIPAFISREDIQYQVAVDDEGRTQNSFNVYFFPTVVLIDRTGVIRAVNPSEAELKRLLIRDLEHEDSNRPR